MYVLASEVDFLTFFCECCKFSFIVKERLNRQMSSAKKFKYQVDISLKQRSQACSERVCLHYQKFNGMSSFSNIPSTFHLPAGMLTGLDLGSSMIFLREESLSPFLATE